MFCEEGFQSRSQGRSSNRERVLSNREIDWSCHVCPKIWDVAKKKTNKNKTKKKRTDGKGR